MKRKQLFALVILSVFFVSCLTGCIVIPFYKNFDISPDTVSSIEIYDLREVFDTDEFLEKGIPAYTIPEGDRADFLQALSEIEFSDSIMITIAAMDPSFSYDEWTIRINYTDGSYEFISCANYGEVFDSNGKRTDSHHWGCDEEEWHGFISRYVPESIFGSDTAA